MNSNAFKEQYLGAYRADKELVLNLSGGTMLVLIPQPDRNISLPSNTDVSLWLNDTEDFDAESGTKFIIPVHSSDHISYIGRFVITLPGKMSETFDHTEILIDPSAIALMYRGDEKQSNVAMS